LLLDASDLGAVLFAPAGFTVAALILSPVRRWPIVLLAAAAAETLLDEVIGGYALRSIAGFVLANLAGPIVGATLVRWRVGRPDIARRRDLTVFLAGAVATGPLVGALIGAATAITEDSGLALGATFLQWWLGDSLGVLLVGSPIVALAASADRRPPGSAEGLGLLAAAAASAYGVYWLTDLPIGFIVLIGVVTAGARCGTQTVTFISLVVAAVAIGSLPAGGPLMAGVDDSLALVLVKLQFMAFAAAGMIVAAEAFERETAIGEGAWQRRTVLELQEALLPPQQMQGSSFKAVGIYRGAISWLKVGGDWYDAVQNRDGTVFVSVGDVVGHGPSTAFVMGSLRFAMSAFAGLGASPAQVLERMDAHSIELDGAFAATVWAASYDPATGELTYSAAGHPPALLKRQGRRWQLLDGGRSVPLGVERLHPRSNSIVRLDGPANLVVYTDGVIEQAGEILDVGLSRLRAALSAVETPDLPRLLKAVSDPSRHQVDDAVILWVELGFDDAALQSRCNSGVHV
jgi:integral membrane sensor domain MASE1